MSKKPVFENRIEFFQFCLTEINPNQNFSPGKELIEEGFNIVEVVKHEHHLNDSDWVVGYLIAQRILH